MEDQRLEALLRHADETFASSIDSRELLAAKARRILSRRRSRRVKALSAVGMSIVVAACAHFLTGNHVSQDAHRVESDSVASIWAELARLDAEVERHLAAAEANLEALRLHQIENDWLEPPSVPVHPMERTTYLLVNFADRLERELGMTEQADASYGLANELYPESPWSIVARERLNGHRNRKTEIPDMDDCGVLRVSVPDHDIVFLTRQRISHDFP